MDSDGNINQEKVMPYVSDFVVEYMNSNVLVSQGTDSLMPLLSLPIFSRGFFRTCISSGQVSKS